MDRPVFGGTTPGGGATTTTGEYVGNDDQTTRTVGPNAKVRIEITGPEVFGKDGEPTQLFKVLDDISTAIKTNDPDGIEYRSG